MDKGERNANLLEEVREGYKAKAVINGLSVYAKELEETYINAIRNDGGWFKFKDDREENCRRLQVLDDLVATIKNKIERGEQALKRLEANNADK